MHVACAHRYANNVFLSKCYPHVIFMQYSVVLLLYLVLPCKKADYFNVYTQKSEIDRYFTCLHEVANSR